MSSARIPPGTRADLGLVNSTIARALGAATGGAPPNIFLTLGRHRGLFRRWLLFAGALMPGGRLPRIDSELLILRVAHTTGCEYEWHHHERLGAQAGLSPDDIARVRQGPGAPGWSPRQALLLRAAEELLADRNISDETWASLSAQLRDVELIELCLLVGHYEMLAMTLNALRVQPDAAPIAPRSRSMALVQRALERRSG
jgi:AhpD family alkylhydroperoxidase